MDLSTILARNLKSPPASAGLHDSVALNGADLVAGEAEGVCVRGVTDGLRRQLQGAGAESSKVMEVVSGKAGRGCEGSAERNPGLQISVGWAGYVRRRSGNTGILLERGR